MPKDTTPGKPTTRRYSDREKADAVRMVRALRTKLGTEHGTAQRVAGQLGYGTESVRLCVRQADIDEGHAPGVTLQEAAKIQALEQENRELRRGRSGRGPGSGSSRPRRARPRSPAGPGTTRRRR